MASNVVLFLCIAFISITGARSATLALKNNCPSTIWPATLTGGGGAQLPITGLELAPQEIACMQVPPSWSGRIWARSKCSVDPTGKFVCQSADCASGSISCNGAGGIPPATLAEFTLNGYGGQDFYDISLVDGFNMPISIMSESGACSSTECQADVNANCPTELALREPVSGEVVGCKSPCLAFNRPDYCCTGAYGSANTCPPSSYAALFKRLCPQAYSYAYDDSTSTFTCKTGGSYVVTFCP